MGAAVITLGVFGTALLYGDGLITPAISVLSAVEGFEVATSAFSAVGHPGVDRDPGRPVRRCSSAGRRASPRSSARSWSCGSPCSALLGPAPDHRHTRPCCGRSRRPTRVQFFHDAPVAGVPGARVDLPRRHRRRGAVRRHGSLRPPGDPALVVHARAPRPPAQLLRAGRATLPMVGTKSAARSTTCRPAGRSHRSRSSRRWPRSSPRRRSSPAPSR